MIDAVSPDFFSIFDISLIHGRTLDKSDVLTSGTARVGEVSQAFARTFWGTAEPIGKSIVTPNGEHLLIVGLAGDTRSERCGIVDGTRLHVLRMQSQLRASSSYDWWATLRPWLRESNEP